MGRSTITHLVILQALVLGFVAWTGAAGAREHDRTPSGRLAFEARDQSKIDVRGTLKCTMPEENNGQACTLQIVDRETGKALRVAASNTAMRLYQDGQTQVVATGSIFGDAIRIIDIRAE